MTADSLTAPAPDTPAYRDPPRPGWREQVRSNLYWGLAHGLPRLAIRAAARRGDLQGRLMLAPTSGEETWDLLEEARAAGPLLRSRLSYLTVDHAVVKEVLSSPDFRSGFPARADGPMGRLLDWSAPRVTHPIQPPSLLVTEPPDHTRYRRLVTRVFTARAVEGLRVRTEEIAHELLDALDPTAPVDLIASYCAPLPVTVICEILGVPTAQRARVLELGRRGAPSLDFGLGWRRYRSVTAGLRDFDQWLVAHIERLRRHPGEDLLSQLIAARVSERTTSVAGIEVPAGAHVVTLLAGANRDPGVFERPERFEVARENARDHVSFSGGRHYCLGASLARMEGEVGLRTLAARFPGMRLLPGARRRPTRVLRGYETLPALLTP